MLEITLGSLFDYPQTKKAEAIMRKRHSVLIMKKYIFVTGRLLESHMRLRKIGPIIIDSRVRDAISRAFIPHSVGANSVPVGHGTTKWCYRLKATTQIPPL